MKSYKGKIWVFLGLVAAGGGWWGWRAAHPKSPPVAYQEVAVQRDVIRLDIQSTGVVQPQNRLEVIPIVAGRMEEILVDEGDLVKKGQILAWMSSSDRAAMLDAALSQGPKEVERWKEIYKPLPLVAPIDGTIIARNMEPGQRVVAATAIFVMSDHLIVKASVDETDIGRVRPGQSASIALDAFPKQPVRARVSRIAHEAKTVSNVTTYEVDVKPEHIPPTFRSGMTGTVTINIEERAGILVVPVSAVITQNGVKGVLVKMEGAPADGVPGAGTTRGERGRKRGRGQHSDNPQSKIPGRSHVEGQNPKWQEGAEPSTNRGEGPSRKGPRESLRAGAVQPTGHFQPVKTGVTDNKRVEILSGVVEGQVVLVPDGGMPWMKVADGPASPFSFGGRPRGGGGRR